MAHGSHLAEAPTSGSLCPIVYVDRHKVFASTTLAESARQRLETAFRAAPWWRDRWSWRGFRAAAREVLREHHGLALIGPGMSFEAPPPFAEMFEPIEIATGAGDETERLRTLSGEAPTRQERLRWLAIIGGIIGGLGVLLILLLAFLRRLPPQAGSAIGLTALFVGLVVVAVFAWRGWSGRWFLIPGAVAIIRRPARRGSPPRVTVLSRSDTCLVFRYIHTGKTTVLMLELWTHAGRCLRRSITEREATGVLAAWQSPLPPPEDKRLTGLVEW